MPGEVIDRPNPGPSPSHLPDEVLSLGVKLDVTPLKGDTLKGIRTFRNAANYIAAGNQFQP